VCLDALPNLKDDEVGRLLMALEELACLAARECCNGWDEPGEEGAQRISTSLLCPELVDPQQIAPGPLDKLLLGSYPAIQSTARSNSTQRHIRRFRPYLRTVAEALIRASSASDGRMDSHIRSRDV
jgi:hypothetical protein